VRKYPGEEPPAGRRSPPPRWDQNQDEVLDENEFSQGLYSTADLDEDQVITIEEEGWFEGWFDGDDIEAEIEDVGDVM
jgi:hypothetical protein